MITRRHFLAALSALPFVGKLVQQKAEPTNTIVQHCWSCKKSITRWQVLGDDEGTHYDMCDQCAEQPWPMHFVGRGYIDTITVTTERA